MLDLFEPDLYAASLKDVPLEKLKDRGIRGLIIDLDNTVTHWNDPSLDSQTLEWFQRGKGLGFKICLVSNNFRDRVKKVAAQLEVPALPRAGKPSRRAFRRAMEILGTGPEETAVIGDQLLTDVLGGNRLHLFTILVVPLSRREFIGTRLMRWIEGYILKRLSLPSPYKKRL